MIKLLCINSGEIVGFDWLKFSDKTSQIWRLGDNFDKKSDYIIRWDFEGEDEFLPMMQLATLVRSQIPIYGKLSLVMPFLPYGRQDKPISNDTTFALHPFLDILHKTELFNQILSFDIHNPKATDCYGVFNEMFTTNTVIHSICETFSPDFICFPDKGASNRGYKTPNDIPVVILDKVRNQQTGEIIGIGIASNDFKFDFQNKKGLIVDDICDGGRTFIEASKLLKSLGCNKIGLYTTHGIYSKGINHLLDNGIDMVYNIHNTKGVKRATESI